MTRARLIFSLWIAVILSPLETLQADTTRENRETIEKLAQMESSLAGGDLQAFVATCERRGWAAPRILSAWYVAQMPDDEAGKKRVEQARRGFGAVLAKKLTETAKAVRETKTSVELETLTTALLSVADWLKAQKASYGNLLLLERINDIASVAAARFVADLTYSRDDAEKWISRIDWKWNEPEVRRQVLHEESGFTRFRKAIWFDQQAALLKEWRNNFAAAQKPDEVKVRPDLAIFTFEDSKPGMNSGMPETCWDRKLHFKFVEGFGSVNFRNLPKLLTFRMRYGTFPLKPSSYVKRAYETEIEAAFWELSWENPYGVAGAWRIYTDYLDGTLADEGEVNRRVSAMK